MIGVIGCSVNNLETEQETTLKIVFEADSFMDGDKPIETRTSVNPNETYTSYEFLWSAQDTVGIYPDTGSQVFFTMANGEGALSATFDGGAWTCKDGHEYRSYYPFIGNFYLDKTKIPVSFTGQKQIGNDNSDHFRKCDYMYTAATSKENGVLNFSYHHLITVVLPWVELPAGHYTGITLSLDESIFVTKGEYSLMAETPAIVGKQFSNEIDVELDVTFNTTDILKVYVPLAPMDMSGKTLTITVTDENDQAYQYTYNPSKAYEAGKIYRLRSPESFADPIISFADNAVKAICVARWDTNNDGELSISEAAAVTSIPYSAFAGNTSITSFDEFQYFTGVTNLGYHVENDGGRDYYGTFSGCTALTFITLPSTLQTITYGCFRDCIGLSSIIIPASVTTIQQVAFLGCTNLDVYMESGVPCALQKDTYGTYNEPYSFGFLTSGRVKTIYVPTQESVNTYKTATYWSTYASIIKWVGDSPTPIDPSSSIVFADDAVKTICVANWDTSGDGELSFAEAAAVTEIQNNTFYGNTEITSFDEFQYFTGVVSLPQSAFYRCSNLQSIVLPNNIQSIGSGVFMECGSLKTITFLSCLDSFGDHVFLACESINRVSIPSMDSWFSVFSELITFNVPGELYVGDELVTEMVLPEGSTSVKRQLCYNLYKLERVRIPDGVTTIGQAAFSGCSSLRSINIPNTITSIGASAFKNCSLITSFTIPYGVRSIADYTFSGCSGLNSISIPNTVTSIGMDAFYDCSSLLNLVLPNTVTSIGGRAFYGCSNLTNINIPDAITTIGGSTFYGCSGLTSITIPNAVTSIDGSAFYGCSSLTNVIVGNSVSGIGGNAFSGCSSLTGINFPEGLKTIGDGAFYGCLSLKTVELPSSLRSLTTGSSGNKYTGAFANTGIERVDCYLLLLNRASNFNLSMLSVGFTARPSSNEYIDSRHNVKEIIIRKQSGVDEYSLQDYSFKQFEGVEIVTLPVGMISIGKEAFSGCSSLTELPIQNTVTTIGMYAFDDCQSLSNITIPDGVTSISTGSFRNCSSLSLTVLPAEPPMVSGSDSFSGVQHIYVRDEYVDIYKHADGWSLWSNIIESIQ